MWPISIRKMELRRSTGDLAAAISNVDDVRRQLDDLRLTLREIQTQVHAHKDGSLPPRTSAPQVQNGKAE